MAEHQQLKAKSQLLKKLGNTKTTLYFRDASGNEMAIYTKRNSNTLSIAQYQIYGSSRLGNYSPKVLETSSYSVGNRSYEFSDHLGNVHLVLDDSKAVQSATEYYPFGMVLQHMQLADEQRFGFNGQEKETELWGGSINYKYRMEDPRLGRFFAVDPLSNSYPWNSSYAFSENRVVDCIELEGLESKGYKLDGTTAELGPITAEAVEAKTYELNGKTYHYNSKSQEQIYKEVAIPIAKAQLKTGVSPAGMAYEAPPIIENSSAKNNLDMPAEIAFEEVIPDAVKLGVNVSAGNFTGGIGYAGNGHENNMYIEKGLGWGTNRISPIPTISVLPTLSLIYGTENAKTLELSDIVAGDSRNATLNYKSLNGGYGQGLNAKGEVTSESFSVGIELVNPSLFGGSVSVTETTLLFEK